jgi:hypothetical protein
MEAIQTLVDAVADLEIASGGRVLFDDLQRLGRMWPPRGASADRADGRRAAAERGGDDSLSVDIGVKS